MTQASVMIATGISTLVGLALAVGYHVDLRRRANLLRKEASRFPMFAVRDHLVRMVASGSIGEEEPAWERTYSAVSALLSMHEKLHLDDVFRRYLAFVIANIVSPETAARSQKISGEMLRARKRCPEYGEALREMEQAFKQMVMMRTGLWHRIKLKTFLWRLTLPAPLCPKLVINVVARQAPGHARRPQMAAPQRAQTARKVQSSLRKPRYGDVAAFGSSQATCL